jgi:pyroglutamyl-peptidase
MASTPRRNDATALPVVLLTGFDPFGGEAINPSWLAASALDGEVIAGHRVVAMQRPTAFARAARALRAALRRHQPALVLCVGQAGGRACLSLERVAVNVVDARIRDNDGAQPVDVPCVKGAPAAYFGTLPVKAMHRALVDAGIPAEVSNTAGTFVCNHVFFVLMHALAAHASVRGGFMHIPYLPEQAARHAGAPALDLGTVVKGLRIALGVALRTRRDRALGAGALH